MFSVSITHHSKIRELNNGNKNWVMMPNTLLNHGSGTHIFWVMGDGNRVMSYENHKSKEPLNVLKLNFLNLLIIIPPKK